MEQEVIDRFWSKVDKAPGHGPWGDCWLWTGYTKSDGYGSLKYHKRLYSAHRFAWMVQIGEIPDGEGWHGTVIRHRCDIRNCVKPEHLELGTQFENIQDRDRRGRHVPSKGDRNGSHTKPESRAFGDRNGSRKHPERLSRGDTHYSRTQPERIPRGERNGLSKLADEQVLLLREKRKHGAMLRELASEFGVSISTAGKIVNYQLWAHLP